MKGSSMEPSTEVQVPDAVTGMSDRELAEATYRKTAAVLDTMQNIHDGLAPMMDKVAPFLASMGL